MAVTPGSGGTASAPPPPPSPPKPPPVTSGRSGGSTSTSGGGPATAATSTATREDYAQQIGWGLALINSSSELRGLFDQAKREDWDGGRFAAAVRNTKWFKQHSEAWRKNEALRLTDPAEWRSQRSAVAASLRDQAQQMGAVIGTSALNKIVNDVMSLGWGEAQIRNALAGYVKFSDGLLYGQAAISGDQLRQTALNNGYKLSDTTLQGWAQAIARGDRQVTDYQDWIREQAAKTFTAFGDQLKAGADLMDLASPYIESYASILELNPAGIDLFDPKLRGALNWRNPETGKVEGKTVTDWETELRQDHRFRFTKQANDQVSAFLGDIGRAWGLVA